jgi:HAD superfamily hydrolase (TIGR01509 family)
VAKLFCFDLNGVLINDEKLHYLAFKNILHKLNKFQFNLSYNNYIDIFSGKTDHEGLASFLNLNNYSFDNNFIDNLQIRKSDFYNNYLLEAPGDAKEQLIVYPSCRLINRLKARNNVIALVTSSMRLEVKKALAILPIDIDAFDLILTKDDYLFGKPHPEPYESAYKKLCFKAEDTIAIEDSPSGVASAIAAGCTCIAITTTHNRYDLRKANWIIEPEELEEFAIELAVQKESKTCK